jgi:hypothetical protein
VRIHPVRRGVKIMPEGAVHVRKRIQPDAVDVGRFNPPQRPNVPSPLVFSVSIARRRKAYSARSSGEAGWCGR